MSTLAIPQGTSIPKRTGRRTLRRLVFGHPNVAIGGAVLILIGIVALSAPLLTPYDPTKPDFASTLESPSAAHPLGTDELGRDILARILFGARIALTAGLVPVAVAAFVGVVLGLISGYSGGVRDTAIMALTDALLAFPDLVLIISITAFLGPSLRNALFAIAITGIPSYVRVVRAQVLSLAHQDFVVAARAIGVSDRRILARHVLPSVVAPVIVVASLAVGGSILAEAALSFLGLGVQPPTSSWGQMVNSGSQFLEIAPWIALVPGVAIFVTVLATNFLGDGIRDALDPRLRNLK